MQFIDTEIKKKNCFNIRPNREFCYFISFTVEVWALNLPEKTKIFEFRRKVYNRGLCPSVVAPSVYHTF
jgi:hypothetical protein